VFGTQSQTKVYRSIAGRGAGQSIDATIRDDATLLWVPDPTALFAESIFTQRQRFELAPARRCSGSTGLPAAARRAANAGSYRN